MPDDFNKNTSIEDEIEKSLQKMVEEETTVAKAYVGNADDYKAEQPSDINDGCSALSIPSQSLSQNS